MRRPRARSRSSFCPRPTPRSAERSCGCVSIRSSRVPQSSPCPACGRGRNGRLRRSPRARGSPPAGAAACACPRAARPIPRRLSWRPSRRRSCRRRLASPLGRGTPAPSPIGACCRVCPWLTGWLALFVVSFSIFLIKVLVVAASPQVRAVVGVLRDGFRHLRGDRLDGLVTRAR